MQEKYVGDTPDFGKYALLRALCDPHDDHPPLRLGVNWYLSIGHEVDHASNNDGEKRHHAKMPERFRGVDDDLWERLNNFQERENRTIAGIEQAGILPQGTLFHSTPLSLASHPREKKPEVRRQWVEQGVLQLADADIVFVDPDNGFEIKSTKRHQKKGPKFTFYDELQPYINRQQSLVGIQFVGRQKGGATALAQNISQRLRQETGFGGQIFTVRYVAGSAILYFVLPAPQHKDTLSSRLQNFVTNMKPSLFKKL